MTSVVAEKTHYCHPARLAPFSPAGQTIALRRDLPIFPPRPCDEAPSLPARIFSDLRSAYRVAYAFLAKPHIRMSLLIGPLPVIGYYLFWTMHDLLTALSMYASLPPSHLVEPLVR